MRSFRGRMRYLAVAGVLACSVCFAGCANSDEGAAIPQREAPTSEQLQSMPPEAQAAAERARQSGDYQAQRMQQMADAQRRANAGQ